MQAKLTAALRDVLVRITDAAHIIDNTIEGNPELSIFPAARLLLRLNRIAERLEDVMDDFEPPMVVAGTLGGPDAPGGVPGGVLGRLLAGAGNDGGTVG